jgi:hypothetical protein
MTANTPVELLDQLLKEGGCIITSDQCSELEIADAQACGRMYVRDDGIGFVRRLVTAWRPKHETVINGL